MSGCEKYLLWQTEMKMSFRDIDKAEPNQCWQQTLK